MILPAITLDDLRRYAVARSLFPPTTLPRALDIMGFVQADPIRAPARAQDLTLRHRVRGYRAGDLERRYASLGVEEDFFVTYGFVTRPLQALMHPRPDAGLPEGVPRPWSAARRKNARVLLEFVRERGEVHPREVDVHFSHGTVPNYWGGSSSATTHLLNAMHYRGWLRVARRAGGIRIYAAHAHDTRPIGAAARRARIDALVGVAVRLYAPLPSASLSYFVRRLRFAVPQWPGEVKAALLRARERLSHARVDGIDWYWPEDEHPARSVRRDARSRDVVRILTPFDPVVHDRSRFELFWGWVYRFEAYTPAARRKRGYYAMPVLWRDRAIGWANVSVHDGALRSELGYVGSAPRDRVFRRELAAELERMRAFLALES